MSAILRYEGHTPNVQVVGYGHFNHGDEKPVDEMTALEFEQPACEKEGWVVVREGSSKKRTAAENESNDASQAQTPRGPGHRRNNN